MQTAEAEPLTEIATDTFDVIVVGGGPVGVGAGIELGTRGLRVLVVDAGNGVVAYPTAESIDIRTMEWLRRVGVAEALERSGFPADFPRDISFVTRLGGRELVRFPRPSNRDRAELSSDVSPEGPAWWPKFWFDPTLRVRARELPGVALHYGWSCTAVAQQEDAVDVVLTSADGRRRTVRAAYVIGCDGARSMVRQLSGIHLEGSPGEATWQGAFVRIPKLLSTIHHRPAAQYYVLRGRRMIFGALDGSEHWRVTYPLVEAERPTPAEIIESIRDAIGLPDVEIELLDARPWTGHTLVASRFRDRRVLLAGDAAHLMWPSGGHGMNTGLGDIANLGWKLAAAVRNGRRERLLDSYEAERKAVAKRNTQRASYNYRADLALSTDAVLEAEGAGGDSARSATAEAIRATREAEWRSIGMQLGFRYEGSPIIVPDGSANPPDDPTDYVPTARPGHRAPHVRLPDGSSILDRFGAAFVLLCTTPAGGASTGEWTAAFDTRSTPLEIVHLDLASVRHAYQADLVLVRPDGIVAWRGSHPPDVVSIVDVATGIDASPTERAQPSSLSGLSAC